MTPYQDDDQNASASPRSCLQVEVMPGDIDDLGHVNNVRFLDYIERGRLDWYNRHAPCVVDPSRRLGTVVVNININFRRECFHGETLEVITEPRVRGGKSYVLYQEVRRRDGEIVVDALVTNVIMDLDGREVLPVPEPLARWFEARA